MKRRKNGVQARGRACARASQEAARRRYADNIFEMGAPSSWNKCAASARCAVTVLHRCACSCAPPCLTMPRLLTTVPCSIRKGSQNFVMLSMLGMQLVDDHFVLDGRQLRPLTTAGAAGPRSAAATLLRERAASSVTARCRATCCRPLNIRSVSRA